MTSVTEIVNRAIDKLGGTTLNDILTDNTKESRLALRMYYQLRDAELRKHYWKFAKARIALAPDVAVPSFEWDYQYTLPNGFLRIFSVNENLFPTCPPAYEIEGNKLLTDEAAVIYLKYIQKIEDPNLFDPLFVELLACSIAWQMCESLTQSNTKKELMMSEYAETLKIAKRVDALEEPPRMLEDGSWVGVRDNQYG